MKQSSFTAKELYGMAFLMKQQKMYGIPNPMGPDRKIELQGIFDGLVAQDVAQMDMDGRISLRPEYHATINIFCNCQKCLTVNVRREDATEQSIIFWLHNGEAVMAEVIEDRYVFSTVDMDTVAAMIRSCLCTEDTVELSDPVVIPQLSLTKALRACGKGDYLEAGRMIRQNGAGIRVGNTIVAGLQKRAYYLGLVYMDMQTGACQKQEQSYLYSDGVMLSLGQTVANLRTCAVFTPIAHERMCEAVETLVNDFTRGGG